MVTKRNLRKHEFIGLEVEILKSKNKTQKGIKGYVIDETQKTMKIVSKDRERVIAKRGSVFRFRLSNGEKVKIAGDEIVAKPEDRIRKC